MSQDDAEFRAWLVERIRVGADPRMARYQALLAIVGGRAGKPEVLPAAEWFLAALEAVMKQQMGEDPDREA